MRVFVSWKAFVSTAGRVPNRCQRMATEAATESCNLAWFSHGVWQSRSQLEVATSPLIPLPKAFGTSLIPDFPHLPTTNLSVLTSTPSWSSWRKYTPGGHCQTGRV